MRVGYCQGPLCVEVAYRADYCDNCEKLRVQHANSHREEGHKESLSSIVMCPDCETIQFQKDRVEGLFD